MLLFSQLLSVVALLATATAQVGLGAAGGSPACATACSLTALTAAQCPLADAKACLCTNTTLAIHVSFCIHATCNLTEQTMAVENFRGNTCKGFSIPSKGAYIIRSTIIVTVFTYFAFALRCIARYMVPRALWWDDWCLFSNIVFSVPMSSMLIYMTTKGYGEHIWDVTPQNLKSILMVLFATEILYSWLQPVTKISILLLYLRIFPNEHFRIAIQITLAFVTCHLTAVLLSVAFQCSPVSAFWDPNVKGKCISTQKCLYTSASLSIFEDMVIFALPIFVLKDIMLAVKKKIIVCSILAIGSFACVASMIRMSYIAETTHSADGTWRSANLALWSMIEVYTATICASLISIRPLLAKLVPKLLPSSKESEPRTKTTGNALNWSSNRLSKRLPSNNNMGSINEDDGFDLEVDEFGRVGKKASETSSVSVTDRDHGIELTEREHV